MDNNRSDNMREGLGDPPATRVNLEAVIGPSKGSGSRQWEKENVIKTLRSLDKNTCGPLARSAPIYLVGIEVIQPVTRFGDFADIMNAPSNVIPQQHQDVGVPLSNTIGVAAPFALRNGKYADILSTMSSADIDAAVNAIVTIGMKFQDEVNKAGSTQLSSSPNVNTSSPLVSPSTTINVPRELNNIDVVATFGVPLTTVGDLHKLINDIEAGKHEELLYGMTNDDRMETLDALDIDNNPSVMASPNSYAGAAGASVKEQPNVISNFRPLVADPVYDGVNISIPRKVIEK
ncbi:hypothetical protein Tco_0770166, partial [Tanacetum coccineum]